MDLVKLFMQKMVIEENVLNSLPNKILQTVLIKLDVPELIAIRGVCRRWQRIIEGICREKRSLVIGSNGRVSHLFDYFNKLADFDKNCAILIVKPKTYATIPLTDHFCTLLARLFPIVENLAFNSHLDCTAATTENLLILLNHWSSTIITLLLPDSSNFPESHHPALYDHINKLSALKRLHFPSVDIRNAIALAQLKHCSLGKLDIVPQLGRRCTSLYLFGMVSYEEITQLLRLNARLVKNLRHLSLVTREHEVLSFVCSNFAAIRSLNIVFLRPQTFNAYTIARLTRLSKLFKLSVESIIVDLTTLARVKLLSLKSVQILSMSRFVVRSDDNQFDGDKFCRVLSSIFPNVAILTIRNKDKLVRDSITKHLGYFVQLRFHHLIDSY